MFRRISDTGLGAGLAISILLVIPAAYFYSAPSRPAAHDPTPILIQYIRAAYARDYKKAYQLISLRDRRLKSESVYTRERGQFDGFTLKVARKLSRHIESRPLNIRLDGNRARVKLALRLPDANSLSPLLLDWDEERLNSLSMKEQRKVLAAIDRLKRDGGLKMIEGAEEFALVKEADGWKLFFDWASGVRVKFAAEIPASLRAVPSPRETAVQPDELFTVTYRVKNLSRRPLSARILHHIEPAALAQHLDLVECALLLPIRLEPGEEEKYSSTYLLRGDLPEGTKELRVTYEFKAEP